MFPLVRPSARNERDISRSIFSKFSGVRRLTIKNVRTQVYSYLFFFEAKLPVRDIIPRGSSFVFPRFRGKRGSWRRNWAKEKRKERRGRGGELLPWKSARKRRLDFTGLEPVGDTRLFLENVFEKTNKGKREGAKREREKNKRGNGLSKNLLVFSRGGFLNWKMKGKDFEVKVKSYQLLLLLRWRLRCLSIRKSIVILSSIYTFYYSNDTRGFIKMDDKTMRPKYVYPRNKLPTAISIFNEKSFRRKNPIPPSKLISRADVNSIPAKR